MPITAAELMKQLEADPAWVARRDQREFERLKRAAAYLEEQKPILLDLQNAGVHYKSLGAMLHSSEPFPKAIPILLKHLQLDYSDPIRETAARCLATKEARYVWDFIVDLYKREPLRREGRSGTKFFDGLAVALSQTVTPKTMEEFLHLLQDPSHGPSRVLMLHPLRRRARKPEIRRLLLKLREDPELEKEIRAWKKSLDEDSASFILRR